MSPGRLWATVAFEAFMLPATLLRDLTAACARKRAARNQWHPLVKERCRPDGPITRLYDMELAEGMHKEESVSDPTAATTVR